MATPYHDHRNRYDEQVPVVERIEVLRIRFRRGTGCCDESPVRIVTADFEADGTFISERDPIVPPAGGFLVPEGMKILPPPAEE